MIVAGFGFTSRATAQSLEAALVATGHTTPDSIAVPSDKALQPAVLDMAQAHGLTIQAIQPDALETVQTQTRSSRSQSERGTGSVAEAAALSAAGPGAKLLVSRCISDDRMATCAIAQGPDT